VTWVTCTVHGRCLSQRELYLFYHGTFQGDDLGSGYDYIPRTSASPAILFRTLALTSSVLSFQIVALQSLHYLTLTLLVPPLLSLFAEPGSLEYEGGAFNVGTPKGSR
jgi:hypothetical protein